MTPNPLFVSLFCTVSTINKQRYPFAGIRNPKNILHNFFLSQFQVAGPYLTSDVIMTSAATGSCLQLAAAWTTAGARTSCEAAASGGSSGFDSDTSPPSSVTSSSPSGLRPQSLLPHTASAANGDCRHLGARPKGRLPPQPELDIPPPPPPMDRRPDVGVVPVAAASFFLSPPPPLRGGEDPRTVSPAGISGCTRIESSDQPCNQSGTLDHPCNQSGTLDHTCNQSGTLDHPCNQSGSLNHPCNQSGTLDHMVSIAFFCT